MLKRTGEEVDYVASFVTEIVFKAKLDSRTGGDFLSDVHFSNFVTVLLAVLRMRTPLFLGMDGRGIV